uniref:D-aminoacyl-tRNA deacylase n=1 Tax=Geoglobus ahangari TaxID=113653 RepID=A0A7C4S5A2_9EURY
MKLIVCSKRDVASQNIKDNLLNLIQADKETINGIDFYISDGIAIADIDERLIYADYIDERLSKYLSFDEILFASRHSSKDGRKIITSHVTGNVGRADYGGRVYSLAKPSPITMKNFAISVTRKLKDTEYEFTLEATHHGPSEIKTPSAFYEIGSTENEWKDEEIAFIVAESMLEAIQMKENWIVALGVGGTHYAPRQTEIELKTIYAFGHIFPKYTFNDLTKEFLKKAYEISEAELIIIDEKSVNSSVKNLLNEVTNELNTRVIKSKEAKEEVVV